MAIIPDYLGYVARTESVEFLPITDTQSLLAEITDSENKENKSEMVEILVPSSLSNIIDSNSSHVETTAIVKASEDSLTKSVWADRDNKDDNSSTRSEAPELNDDREIMDGNEHDHLILLCSSSTTNPDVSAANDLNDDPTTTSDFTSEQIAQQGCKDSSLEEVETVEQFIDDALAQLNEKSNSKKDSEPGVETPPEVPPNEINATQTGKKEGMEVAKERTVLEDVQDNLFTLTINSSKRKGKMSQLKEEEFDMELYVRNTAGFSTSHPVKWSMALEKYIEQYGSTRCRWRYKKEETGVYSEANLILYFDTTKKIDMKINYGNGVIMVQGEPYKNWVKKEFPKVREQFEKIEDCPEEKVEECSRKSACNSRDAAGFATTADVDLVWEKIDEMILAMKNQDDVMQVMIERCQSIELNTKKHTDYVDSTLPNELLELELKIDKRCAFFMETTTASDSEKVEELKKNVTGQLNSLKSKIGEIQVKLQTATGHPSTAEETSSSVDLIAEKIDAIDFVSKIQTELTNTKFIETDDPKLQKMERDILNMEAVSNLRDSKLTNINLNLKAINLQLDALKANRVTAPPPPPPPPPPQQPLGALPLMSMLPGIPPIPTIQQSQSISSCSQHTGHTTSNEHRLFDPRSISVNHEQSSGVIKDALELLLCFDSNGRHIDRKKLWKKNDSEYKQCGSLHKLAEEIKKLPYKSLRYILISVGTNDLDVKDHEQVLGELQLIISDIRSRFPGIKFIINEFLPRRDNRNSEVAKFNAGLGEYAKGHHDITIASQQNITDMSMLYDAKHLLESKVPIYAKNIIIALLEAYGIRDKRELFVLPSQSNGRTNGIHDRMMNIADYRREARNIAFQPSSNNINIKNNNNSNNTETNRISNDARNKESVIRDAIMQFSDVILKCIQR